MSESALKRTIMNAWRLERPGKWVGYDGVQVVQTEHGFRALDASGEPLIRMRKAERVFPTAEKAFEAVEKHLVKGHEE